MSLQEAIRHRLARETADYFSDKIEAERLQNKVPVLIKDNGIESIYFFPCNQYGMPTVRYLKFLSISSDMLKVISQPSDLSVMTNTFIDELCIYIEEPLIIMPVYEYTQENYFGMWSGRIMSKSKIPIEKLDVSELMKLAQKAIEKREGIILDEVLSNKIIK